VWAERTTMRQVREIQLLKFVGGLPNREIARGVRSRNSQGGAQASYGLKKNCGCRRCRRRTFPMKIVAEVIGLSGSNLAKRLRGLRAIGHHYRGIPVRLSFAPHVLAVLLRICHRFKNKSYSAKELVRLARPATIERFEWSKRRYLFDGLMPLLQPIGEHLGLLSVFES
jgi:hypothetical protein